MKKKKISTAKKIAAVVLVFSSTAAIVFGTLALRELLDRKRGADFYESVGSEKVMAVPTEPTQAIQPTEQTIPEVTLPSIVPEPIVSQTEPFETGETMQMPAETEPETHPEPTQDDAHPETAPTELSVDGRPEELLSEPDVSVVAAEIPEETYPLWDVWCGYNRHFTTGTEPSVLDFEAMREKFPDCVGWIEIPALKLDVPIVKGEDNSYYLTHLPNRRESANGSLMMDISCRADFHSDITTIHGHYLQDGTMFGNLKRYQEERFYQENPAFKLYTPDGDYTVEVFATNTLDGMEFGYPTELNTEEEFNDFIAAAREACPYETDAEVQWGDRILLLSTCSYKFQFARLVVFGVLR